MSLCEYEKKVHACHDGELSPQERRAVEAHIRSCAECARELENLRRLSGFFASARMPDLSPEVIERLRTRRFFMPERMLLRTSEFFAAAAAVVLLACAAWLWHGYSAGPSTDKYLSSWEGVAVTLRSEVQSSSGAESHVAQWIVADLSGGY